jgi:hypothetical protein
MARLVQDKTCGIYLQFVSINLAHMSLSSVDHERVSMSSWR